MKKKIVISWYPFSYRDSVKQKNTNHYAISEDNELLYIGKSEAGYHIHNEIKRNIESFGYRYKRITVWLGYLEWYDFKRKPPKFVIDVERYLIYFFDPRDNRDHANKCNFRDDIEVVNTGCPFLATTHLFMRFICSQEEWEFENKMLEVKKTVDKYEGARMKPKLYTGDENMNSREIRYKRLKIRVDFDKEEDRIVNLSSSIVFPNGISKSEINDMALTKDEKDFLDAVMAQITAYLL